MSFSFFKFRQSANSQATYSQTNDLANLQRILLTGGAGFIGSHLLDKLLDSTSAQIVVVDNLLTGDKRNIQSNLDNPRVSFYEQDLTDLDWLQRFLEQQKRFDLILHFASPASPPRYQEEPVLTYQVNAFVTHYLAQYAAKQQSRLLFASTSEVYGDPTVSPQSEKYWGNVNPNGIRSCYDEGKRFGETVCGVWQRQAGADIRIIRIFNTYGPRMDLHDGRVIPSFFTSVLNRQPLSIYGDGQQTRSFCYVSDLIAAIWQMITLPNLAGKTINLGNPQEFTMLELATKIEEITKVKLPRQHHPLPEDDPTQRKPDIKLAKKYLSWKPEIKLAEGLKLTYEYFQKNS